MNGPFVTTDRLELWAPTPDDLEFLVSIYTDPFMMARIGGTLAPEVVAKRLDDWRAEWVSRPHGSCIIRWRATGAPIGISGIVETAVQNERVLEIGWMVAPSFQGRGVAFEAARGQYEFARDRLELRALTAFPGADNVASNRICEKLGMSLLGQHRYEFQGLNILTHYWRVDFPPLATPRLG
jgi:RimJ/RimL family protein N-acetyltransferase